MRSPGWVRARDVSAYPVGSSLVVVADYEQEFVPFDGMQRAFRRFGLARWDHRQGASGEWVIADTVTVRLSSGGMDLVAPERRDLDGDGVPELTLHYQRTGPNDFEERGLVVASSDRLSHVPLSHVLTPEVTLFAHDCWFTLDGHAALFVTWDTGPAVRVAAYAWTPDGLRSRRVFGVVLARDPSREKLTATLPAQAPPPAASDDGQALLSPECYAAPGYLVQPDPGGGFALLGGFSATREGAGRQLGHAGSAPREVVAIEPLEAFVWPTNPALR